MKLLIFTDFDPETFDFENDFFFLLILISEFAVSNFFEIFELYQNCINIFWNFFIPI